MVRRGDAVVTDCILARNSAALYGGGSIAADSGGSWGDVTIATESGTSTPAVVTVQDTAPPATNGFPRLRVARP